MKMKTMKAFRLKIKPIYISQILMNLKIFCKKVKIIDDMQRLV